MMKRFNCLVIAIMVFYSTGVFVHGMENDSLLENTTEIIELSDEEPPSREESKSTAESTPTSAPKTQEVQNTNEPTEQPYIPSENQKTTKKVSKVTGLKKNGVGNKSVKLNWNKTKNATGYEVYRYSNKKKQYIKYKNTSNKTVTIKKLKSGTKYKFKVRGYRYENSKMVKGQFSKTVSVKTKTNKKNARNKLVKKAKSKIGSRYVSGGQGPNSFDCSGFVYWTYKNANIKTKKKIVRTSANKMYNRLRKYKVSSNLNKAKKGDIIFYRNGGSYTHVAIFIGGGKIVHASTPAKGVCITKASACRSSSIAVVRII